MAVPDDACDDQFADPGSRTVPSTASGGDVPRSPKSETVTQILSRIAAGDRVAAEHLLPLVYDELRQLAAAKMAREKPGQTLQPTALVHEAYLRLVGVEGRLRYRDRNHFFAAAATAMRRILVDSARAKQTDKRGGGRLREPLADVVASSVSDELVALNEALGKLAVQDPLKAQLVELRYFAGLTGDQAASVLGISPSTADRHWVFARAWLQAEVRGC
jgi:RNA polymerase sigma factor (TIGR02999 family)